MRVRVRAWGVSEWTHVRRNLCYTTYVEEGSPFDNLEGVEYYTLWIEDPTSEKPPRRMRFVQPRPGEPKALLPSIMEHLLSYRKATRKLQKGLEKTDPKYAILEGRQLALKVSANSVYGFCGAQKGYLPYGRMIAESITAIGREQLLLSKQIAEERYGMDVIYGDTDSIMFTRRDINEEYLAETSLDKLLHLVPRTADNAHHHDLAKQCIERGFDTWAGFKYQMEALPEADRTRVRACVRWAGELALRRLMESAEEIGRVVTETIGRAPMSLEFEALFDQYRQFGKKRCVACMPFCSAAAARDGATSRGSFPAEPACQREF